MNQRHDAWLVLDDAHGVGVVGATGHGTLERFGLRSPRIVYMATLGKAAGSAGAFVAGDQNTRVRRRMNLARYRTVGTQTPMLGSHEFLALFLPLELVLSPGRVGGKPQPLPDYLVDFDDEQQLVHRELHP